MMTYKEGLYLVTQVKDLMAQLAAVPAPIVITPAIPTVTLLAGVNVLTSSVVIAPANALRKGMIIFNNSANSTYVSLAAVSVPSTCTRLIATYTSWEVFPPGLAYTGPISAIRNSGTGVVSVWEFT